ncbi:outer membrane protein assembly factor BamB family protein [Actinoplanes aureus]|uniref:PQQ-binding-like beta-propeller repeat protein n=1 Tax=Actinoplanes aureus TaxID=2792083 RepID=A0A931BYR9_9ACTN|nr:PQQ-binding-like beta-propeller repeat protein [Actinoplanes aureus]MBG0560004.1 PQQ-binding-like beta-propeller repeat protein [Actinoplanes aureus]
MTLIELDRDAPLDPEPSRRPPPWRYRHAGLLVAAVLLIALGGAVPTGGTRWRDLGTAGPVSAVEIPIQLAGGRLYTAAVDGPGRELTAWALEQPPRRLWTAQVPIGMSYDPGRGVFGSFSIRQSGDVVLLSEGFVTTAIDARDGRVRWTSPVMVTLLTGGGTGVVVERVFRPGTDYDQASGDPGPLYFSADGVPHTEPPIRTEVRGTDLATGRVVWTVTPPGSVTVDAVRGDRPAVLITASDRLTLLAGATGTTLAEVALPELNGAGPATASVVGDVALVGYQDPGRQVGYDTRTLRRLWDRPLPATSQDRADCRDVLCSGSRDGLSVLDPVTGATAWPVTGEVGLARHAGFVLETETRTGRPVRLADPRTGRDLADLSGWDEAFGAEPDGALVLRRAGAGGKQTFAAVLPGHPQPRVLGTATVDSGECAADEHHLVCREGDGMRIWAYRI